MNNASASSLTIEKSSLKTKKLELCILTQPHTHTHTHLTVYSPCMTRVHVEHVDTNLSCKHILQLSPKVSADLLSFHHYIEQVERPVESLCTLEQREVSEYITRKSKC